MLNIQSWCWNWKKEEKATRSDVTDVYGNVRWFTIVLKYGILRGALCKKSNSVVSLHVLVVFCSMFINNNHSPCYLFLTYLITRVVYIYIFIGREITWLLFTVTLCHSQWYLIFFYIPFKLLLIYIDHVPGKQIPISSIAILLLISS